MKKLFSLLSLLALVLFLVSCSAKPVSDEVGKKITDNIPMVGKEMGKECMASFTSEEILKKAIADAGASERGYAAWIETENGKKVFQAAIGKCMGL